MDLATALMLLPALVIGVTVHEFAHAFSASLLGDKFSRRQGRVSLNPLRHISPLGTLAVFLLRFGWGRPVMINLYNFKRPKRDYLLASLAGPLANVVVVGVCIALMQLTRHTYRHGPRGEWPMSWAHLFLTLVAIINTMLATINLLPIPPLDGSKIWPVLIPRLKPAFGRKSIRLFVLLLVVLVWTDSLHPVIEFVFHGLEGIMPPSDEMIFSERCEAAQAAFEAREFPQAEALYGEALAINPRADHCFYWRACARGWQENWPGALQDMNRAIELNGRSPDYHEFRATLFEELGRAAFNAKKFAEAERLFTEALAVNPRAEDCFYWRACARGWQENWPGALQDMNRAIDLDGRNPDYYDFRATVFEQLGRADDAARDRAVLNALRDALMPTSGPAPETRRS